MTIVREADAQSIYPNLPKEQRIRNKIAVWTYYLVAILYSINTVLLYLTLERFLPAIIFLGLPVIALFGIAVYGYKEHNKDPFPDLVIFYSFFLLFSITITDKLMPLVNYPLNLLLYLFYAVSPFALFLLYKLTE